MSNNIGRAILEQDMRLARAMNVQLSGIQKGMSHEFLGLKLREAISTQTITSDIVSPDLGLPDSERGVIISQMT